MARKVRINGWTMVAGLVVMTAAVTPANGGTFYVDAASTAIIQDGTSWCSAWDNLQDALAEIPSGAHVIRVAQGTYKPHASDRTVSFVMLDDVDIKGGFAGRNACVDPDTQNSDLYPTILSGELGTAAATDNSYHVITCADGVEADLEGLTIRDGYANGTETSGEHRFGGGIRNGYFDSGLPNTWVEGGTLTLDDCEFIDNWAKLSGGGMTNVGHAATVTDCTFSGNHSDTAGALAGGGAFYNRRAFEANNTKSVFTDCDFDTNHANWGGGAVSSGGLVTAVSFTRCTFDQNSSGVSGGAVDISNGGANIVDCEFTDNTSGSGGAFWGGELPYPDTAVFSGTTFTGNDSTTTGTDAGGGAIWSGGNTDLLSCTFTSNTAKDDGGAVYIIRPGQSTAMEIAACIFDGNTSELSGGAVYEGDVNLEITYLNSLFVNNEANGESGEGGGAIRSVGATNVSYVNCTFVANTAEDGDGGGILVRNNFSPVVTNCILWDNCDGSTCSTEDESAQIHISGSGNGDSVTHCTIEGCADPGFCEDSNDLNKAVEPNFVGTGAHPFQLVSSTNNALIDDGDGENAGSDCRSVNTTTADLAGGTRFIRKDGVCVTNAVIIDIGAYEVQNP